MKRIIALMLVLLAVVSLAACRENTNDPADTTDAESTAVTTEDGGEDTTVSDEETTSPEDEETTDADEETDAVTEPATEAVTKPSTEEDTTHSGVVSISPEDRMITIARDYLGDVDPDSGYRYSFH